MSADNKALVQRWFEEVWNKGRADAIEEMFAADGIAHGLSDESGSPLRGPAGFKQFHANFRGAFPDMQIVIEDMVAEDDKVAQDITREPRTGLETTPGWVQTPQQRPHFHLKDSP